MDDFLLTVVIPVYNEAGIIKISVERTRAVLIKAGINHEFILVDDGSLDSSWNEIIKLVEEHENIVAIKLSRNFGKESAICAGLDAVNSDCCILMDADMQHPPEYIPEMVRKWRDENFDIVEGVKCFRGKEPVIKKIGARLFYKSLNTFCGLNLENASDFRLMDRKVLEAWKTMPERDTFFRAMSTWVGYKRGTVMIEIAARCEGVSKWSFSHLFRLAVSAIAAFTAIPLYLVTIMGLAFLTISLVLGIQTLVKKLMGQAVEGFTTVILLLLIIGSILMISLGIIGIYIAKIYNEVKQRPRYLIAETVRNRR